jgi:hypothetical protein
MREDSISIYKVVNGWRVNHSWQEKDAKGETDYKDEDFVFLTLEDTMAKITEIVTLIA